MPDTLTTDHQPVCDIDPFTRENIKAPYDYIPQLREPGPLVWMSKYGVWASGRYDIAKAILTDHATYRSGAGVGLTNFVTEKPWRPPSKLLEADQPEHTPRRAVADGVMAHKNLRPLRPGFDAVATEMIDRLLKQDTVDGVTDIAQPFILKVFPDAVGLGPDGREQLLAYGNMVFNGFGPLNDVFDESVGPADQVVDYIMTCCNRDELDPKGLGMQAYEAADDGKVTHEEALFIVRSMLSAGLDTTVDAIGNALNCFAQHPDQWQKLREDPLQIRNAIEEVLRYDSPFQIFFRTTSKDVDLAGHHIPKDHKVMVSLGSANRDPDFWERPDEFDVERNAAAHLGFGFGIHHCMGQAMARLELQSLFTVLAEKVERIEPAGPAERRINNTLHGFEHLPLKFHPA